MWIVYNRMPVKVVGANELDLRKILKKGDKVTYESYYASSSMHNYGNGLPLITGTVLSASRYHATVRLPGGWTDTANWFDIRAINRKKSEMQAYRSLMERGNVR